MRSGRSARFIPVVLQSEFNQPGAVPVRVAYLSFWWSSINAMSLIHQQIYAVVLSMAT